MTICSHRTGLALLAVALIAGCNKPPQMAHDNLRLVEALQTAISARQPQWLAASEKLVDERHAAAKLSAVEYAALRSIIDEALAGNWGAARCEIARLAKAQRPKAEDLERLRAGGKS
jgi:hypothetical protein